MRLLFALMALVFATGLATASERILLFDSDVTIASDGTLTVTETIRVNAEGRQIRRGIFRDFPLLVEDAQGREKQVGFRVTGVTRNGNPEPYRVERSTRAARVYIGQSEVFLPPGVHTYELSYETDRQLRFFEDRDELFWNATGNFWTFPIEVARATIRLPDGARATDVTAFTGRFGSREQNATSRISSDGTVALFETTQTLGPQEGLTVGVQFPSGFIDEPSTDQQLAWWWRDYAGDAIAVGGLGGVLAFFLWAWNRVGRDPPKEVVVPRWELPEGVSPALTNYIDNRGLEGAGFTALSSAALNLAVAGLIELDNDDGTMTMRRTDKPSFGADLPVGEHALLNQIEKSGGTLTIDKSNGARVRSMSTKFNAAMENEHRAVYYRSNMGYVIAGVIASIGIAIATFAWGGQGAASAAALIPLAFAGLFVTPLVVSLGRNRGSGFGGKLSLIIRLFMIAVVLITIGGPALMAMLDFIDHPVLIGALAALLMINVLFLILMGAPTPLGQTRTAEIEGLKRYLTVAEEDRMNMLGSPDMSPQHYETLLPYAVALGVEKPWSEAFQKWLTAAAAAGVATAVAYHGPRWYRGDSFRADRIGDSMGNLAGDLSKSMTASMPAPKSSSSGFSSGGGFSGGGGGGGGGGGW